MFSFDWYLLSKYTYTNGLEISRIATYIAFLELVELTLLELFHS